MAWAVFGILVVSSALAVVLSYFSGALAIVVVLAGVVAGNVLAWAAQPAPDSGSAASESRTPERGGAAGWGAPPPRRYEATSRRCMRTVARPNPATAMASRAQRPFQSTPVTIGVP